MSTENPEQIFREMFESRMVIQKRLQSRARYFSIGRFITFLAAITAVVAAFMLNSFWWGFAIILTAGFVVLVVFNEFLTGKQKFNDACLLAVEQELQALDGKFSLFETGEEFIDPAHIYTTDLDIFGNNSLYQTINRATTLAGKLKLAGWLCNPLRTASAIYARQDAIRELGAMPGWRIKLRAYGMVAGEEKKDLDSLFEWLAGQPLFHSAFFRYSIVLVPIASFLMTALLIAGVVTIKLFLLYLILPISITGFHTKSINKRHAMLSKKVQLLKKYAFRFGMIEQEKFSSAYLAGLQLQLKPEGQTASIHIRKLSKITASLDTRLNLLAGFLLNIFMLWDIRQMRRLENWQLLHKEHLFQWFDALAETEAVASFGAFAFHHPVYIYPAITADSYSIKAVDAGHPLIPASVSVSNHIHITHKGHFNIVTGANMAGKSTYLRTVGVNMVLALAGSPVCAKKFTCYPAPVFTSLRTTDSLSTNQSYFYAELLRLKEMIDRLSKGEELFILLDEILKGTNSVDKQAGSKALLTQLIGLGAAGFIATHDLELGNLAQVFPLDVTNFHFEAEIIEEELHFDYKLNPGIARNMNATFLMKKMGITI